MAKADAVAYEAVREDLGRRLRSLRGDCPPLETARVLLSSDGAGQRLVGVRYDGEKAVYFQAAGRGAIAASFGSDGIDQRGGLRIAVLRGEVSVGQWAEKMRYYWGWRHPRFRG